MSLRVDVQRATDAPTPEDAELQRWIAAALTQQEPGVDTEISLRLVDEAEMGKLNRQYRHRNGPTNVLSFPADLPPGLQLPLLGDIVICAPLVGLEAAEQGKQVLAHWAHLTVHGTLHLLGHDHLTDAEAEAMEALETGIMARLDLPCPYAPERPREVAAR